MINRVLLGELDPKLANCAAYMCTVFLNAQAHSQIEQRLAELEAVVRVQSLDPRPVQELEPIPGVDWTEERMEAGTGQGTESTAKPQGGDDDD